MTAEKPAFSHPPIVQKDESLVVVFQGGGALGAYQAGVFEELAAHGAEPSWVAGISIGAINAALVAGNPPARRVAALRSFWEEVSSGLTASPLLADEISRTSFNHASAATTALFGVPGFFKPRILPAVLHPPGTQGALGIYDTTPLKATLERLVDFDYLNKDRIRLSLGAVNVATGNFRYFDSRHMTIGPEHVMASGALPPGFSPVEIEGEHYWDGGLVSNTPLQYVLDEESRQDLLIFQVDLFSARGPLPQTLLDLSEREKDIRFSSRTRLNTDMARERQKLRRALHRLLAKLPAEFDDDVDAGMLREVSNDASVTIVHLINRRRSWSRDSKDYEFSRHTATERWADGRADVRRTIEDERFVHRQKPDFAIQVIDFCGTGRD
jgi:NTE family protein